MRAGGCWGGSRGSRGRGTRDIQSILTSYHVANPRAQPHLLGQGCGSNPGNPWAYFSGLRKGNKNSQHIWASQVGEVSYIILLKLPVLLLGQNLIHHRRGLLPLADVLPLLARDGRQDGVSLGSPCLWLVLSLDTPHIPWKPDPATWGVTGLLGPAGFLGPGAVAVAAPHWFQA